MNQFFAKQSVVAAAGHILLGWKDKCFLYKMAISAVSTQRQLVLEVVPKYL